VVSHRGRHHRVENARIFTCPEVPPPVLVSGFGPKAIELAGRVGDGFVTTSPDADGISQFHEIAGDKPVQAGTKVCWAESKEQAIETAHRIWPNDQLPGELAQVLPTPEHFEQAVELVTEEMVAEVMPCGPDLDEHLETFSEYADAGVDELFVQQVGGNHEGFFDAYRREVLPRFRSPGMLWARCSPARVSRSRSSPSSSGLGSKAAGSGSASRPDSPNSFWNSSVVL
jgi:G6PDH family F420-dependent oxidoreductase